MKTSFTFDDGNFQKRMHQLEKQSKTHADRALKEGAKYLADELEKVTPVGPPRKLGKYGANKPYEKTHMKDDVKFHKTVEGTYEIGYGKDTAWRAIFVNNGTVNMSGQFFFDKLLQNNFDAAYRKVQDQMEREFDKLL